MDELIALEICFDFCSPTRALRDVWNLLHVPIRLLNVIMKSPSVCVRNFAAKASSAAATKSSCILIRLSFISPLFSLVFLTDSLLDALFLYQHCSCLLQNLHR